jgi:hypothetical protein
VGGTNGLLLLQKMGLPQPPQKVTVATFLEMSLTPTGAMQKSA